MILDDFPCGNPLFTEHFPQQFLMDGGCFEIRRLGCKAAYHGISDKQKIYGSKCGPEGWKSDNHGFAIVRNVKLDSYDPQGIAIKTPTIMGL